MRELSNIHRQEVEAITGIGEKNDKLVFEYVLFH
jgi:hypothetical protein